MTRAEKAKLLQFSATKPVVEAAPIKRKIVAVKTFEIDGEQIPFEAERPDPKYRNEANVQANRDWLRQARARAERNDD